MGLHVCEGVLLLARAGLLDGHEATTHWCFTACLQSFPRIKMDTTRQRFVVSRNASDNRLTERMRQNLSLEGAFVQDGRIVPSGKSNIEATLDAALFLTDLREPGFAQLCPRRHDRALSADGRFCPSGQNQVNFSRRRFARPARRPRNRVRLKSNFLNRFKAIPVVRLYRKK
jgi:hypothetical protein